MPRNVALRVSAIAAWSIAILCWPAIARAQTVDANFNPGADQVVWSMAAQPDGKIIVGGGFTHLGGGSATTTVRNHIGRLNTDGTVDSTFNPGTNSIVQAIAVQPDGKILIGGNFTAVGGGTGVATLRSGIARLNADGTVDTSFDPGANNVVYALVVQPDGKILVGGAFSTLGGGGTGTTTRNALGRLNADGSLDSFNPGASKTGGAPIVYSMALQLDGKVVVGGYFTGLGAGTGATTRNYIGRVNADGSLDSAFNPGASFYVNALALQADGRIIVGGDFIGLGGADGVSPGSFSLLHIGRLNTDGSVDASFNPGTSAEVHTLGVQADGKILAAGYFTWMGAAGNAATRSVRNYIGRLNADGTVDGTFNPGADNIVESVLIQADGAVVAGGHFGGVGGGNGTAAARLAIARFSTTNQAIQFLILTGGGSSASTMTWGRSGAGPEVSRVTFEWSEDGSFYSLFGSGSRVPGGWQVTGVNLPTNLTLVIRARGYYGSGFQNGSGSIVESILTQLPSTPPTPARTRNGDFDGDGKADLTVFRPSTGTWFVLQSGTNYATATATQWGNASDIVVPGDYDGDGKADIAVFRPSTGTWFIVKSSTGTAIGAQWGNAADVPVPGDYDGDGKTDIAVFRPSTGTWFIAYAATNFTTFTGVQWGNGSDVPVPGDYDGDGKTDVAVFRPSTGTWFIAYAATTFTTFKGDQWGTGGDVAVPGDYDGDGKTDIAVFRPSSGTWYIAYAATGFTTFTGVQWGNGNDVPVPGDYDGDGKTDVAVFRPSNGTWYIIDSSTGSATAFQWGNGADIPILKRP